MKKVYQFSFISLILLLFNSTNTFAITGYINPILSNDGRSFIDSNNGYVTYNDTSVTLMWDGKGNAVAGIEEDIVAGACYILGKGYTSSSVVTINGQEYWAQVDNIETFGWTKYDFARQSGGNLCGFLKNPIKGSGSDTPADYVRADEDGRLWYHRLCENFDGVRFDCNEEFALGKVFKHTLFRVYCGYFSKEDDNYADAVEKGDIGDGQIPDDDDRKKYVMQKDEMCDLSKANYNDKGERVLQIYEDTTNKQTGGNNNRQQMLWRQAFKMVFEPSSLHDLKSEFTVKSDLSTENYNPEGKTVKTEFGEISRKPVELAEAFIRFSLGIAGGIAFLLMVLGSFRLIFARGDPEQVQQGREILTAAIAGLLLIIFATFLLQLVGISILGLDI